MNKRTRAALVGVAVLERRGRSLVSSDGSLRPRGVFAASWFLFYLVCSLLPLPCFSYFQSWDPDPVTRGLAGTGGGRSGSLSFGFLNPAALSGLRNLEFRGSLGRLVWGLSDESVLMDQQVSAGFPWGSGALGVSWQRRGLEGSFYEDRIRSGYAWEWGADGLMAVGAALDWMRVTQSPLFWTNEITAFQTLNPSGWALSVGVLLRPLSDITLGVSAESINQPSLSFVGDTVNQPLVVRAGLSTGWEGWTFSGDYVFRGAMQTFGCGAEYRAGETLGLRGGIKSGLASGLPFALMEVTGGFTVGWDWEWGRCGLDYALVWPIGSLSGTSGSHRVGFSLSPHSQGLGSVADPSAVAVPGPLDINWLPLPQRMLHVDHDMVQEREEVQERLAQGSLDPILVHRAAWLNAVTGQWSEAVKRYQMLMALDPKYEAVAIAVLHRLRFQPLDPSATSERMLWEGYQDAMTGQAPTSIPPEVWLGYGMLAQRAGKRLESVEGYRWWFEDQRKNGFDPVSHGGALVWLIQAAIEGGALTLAEEAMAPLASRADHPLVLEAMGRLAMAKGDAGKSLQIWRQADAVSQSGRSRFHMGVAMFKAKQYSEAFQVFQEAAKLDSSDSAIAQGVETCRRQAVAYYLQEGDRLKVDELRSREALEAYQHALSIAPGHPEASSRLRQIQDLIKQQVEIYAGQAKKNANDEQYEKALENWLNVLKADPKDPRPSEEIPRLANHMKNLVQKRLDERLLTVAYRLLTSLETVPQGEMASWATKEKQRHLSELIGKATEAQNAEQFPAAKKGWEQILEMERGHPQAQQALMQTTLDARARALAFLTLARSALDQRDFLAVSANLGWAKERDPDTPDLDAFTVEYQREYFEFKERKVKEIQAAVAAGDEKKARQLIAEIPDHPKAKIILSELNARHSSQVAKLWQASRELESGFEPEKALVKIRELLKVQPGHAEGAALKILIEQRMAKAKDNADVIQALILKGDVAYGNGNVKAALAAYEEAGALDYYNQDLRTKITGTRKELK